MARFFGCALIAMGLLITLLSGGCTLAMLVSVPRESGASGDGIGFILAVGLPFIAIGLGLLFGGGAVFRGGGQEEPAPQPESPGGRTPQPGDDGPSP